MFRLQPAKFARWTCSRGLANSKSFSSRKPESESERNEFDYVIVGAGSAGCVLTHRLSAAGNNVCLLEAGPSDKDDVIHDPARWSDLFYHKKYNWNYWTTPQAELGNRRMYWPRGKVLGGSSSVNVTVYMRPHPLDMDRWAFKENAYGWSHAETLPYFKLLENYRPNDDYPQEQLRTYRGVDGPLNIIGGKLRSVRDADHKVNEAYVEACKQHGVPYTHDANGYQQEGVFWIDSTVHNDRRVTAATAYLSLALKANASRVHVETDAHATKLLFDGSKKRVIGVETATAPTTNGDDKTRSRYYARKDVIVSCGTINSPQLLQLSGIGNADELRQVGIEAVVHLPGVGANLQDHTRFVLLVERKAEEAQNGEECSSGGDGFVLVGAHIRTSDKLEQPNVQLHFGSTLYDDVADKHLRKLGKPIMFMGSSTQQPFSHGYVRLASANAFDSPIVDARLFTDPRDVADMITAFKFCQPIFRQAALSKVWKAELFPDSSVPLKSDKEIESFLRASCSTAYHLCGTCKMGDINKDPAAVVDPLNMRVHGVDGLRVVDASVMPSEPNCNPNAPTLMIAERASDLILGRKPLAPESVPFYRPRT